MTRRGFTLLEVVLALSLAILLLGSSMTFLWELADRRSTLARGSRDLHAGAILIERLEADLSAGLVGDPGIGAGITGTATKLRLLTRGVWLAPEAGGKAGGEGEGDLQATEYEFDPSSGRITGRRGVVKPGSSSISGPMELISDRVERVRFRYFDGKEWVETFDSLAKGELPVAIEVAVWFTALKNDTAPATETPASETAPEDGASVGDDNPAGVKMDAETTERRWPAPDRLRVIIVPDGPVSTWKEGA
jgi:hypothetical protein